MKTFIIVRTLTFNQARRQNIASWGDPPLSPGVQVTNEGTRVKTVYFVIISAQKIIHITFTEDGVVIYRNSFRFTNTLQTNSQAKSINKQKHPERTFQKPDIWTMAETKMNKTRLYAGRLREFIRLKCHLIFTI